ncbi:DUF6457 domain-containing protein [Demequina sp.]|uniref:DUF6457 domain-containing protein n=1 Tax=Demequina sp. TaxID=2050685 RepID=UPI003A848320
MASTQLESWSDAVAQELGLDLAHVDPDALLDVARDAAHSVARPAAPLTTYLIGYAVAKGASLEEACASASALAQRWTQEMPG